MNGTHVQLECASLLLLRMTILSTRVSNVSSLPVFLQWQFWRCCTLFLFFVPGSRHPSSLYTPPSATPHREHHHVKRARDKFARGKGTKKDFHFTPLIVPFLPPSPLAAVGVEGGE